MEITYLGHSAFRLRGKGVTIVTDPYPPTLGLNMGRVNASIVTVSHGAPNHSYTVGVAGDPQIVDGPGEYEISDVLIAGVATETETDKRPLNTAYVFRLDEVAVCHLGDLNSQLTDKQVEEIGNIDALLLPVGGGNALGPTEAAEVVAQLDPSLVIPMHYRLNGSGAGQELASVDSFIREMGSKDYVPEPKVAVTKSSGTGEVRVVVLENKRVQG